MSFFRYSIFQWLEVLSVIAFVVVIVTESVTQFLHITVCSALLGLCPGFRAAIMVSIEKFVFLLSQLTVF